MQFKTKIGKVEKYIYEKLDTQGSLLLSVIDPLDYKSEKDAINSAVSISQGGADLIVVGGSTGVQGEILDDLALKVKEKVDTPIVLFPGNIATITKYADAIYFMSLLNARNPYWITQAQMLAAPLIRQMNIEALPIGYIVVSPGGTVGWVGDANLVPREKPNIAAALALAGQYLGDRFIITDTGSNPRMQHSGPVPEEMVRAVKSVINVPYIVAGGIISDSDISKILKAGADMVQIGTAFEKSVNVKKTIELFSRTVKEEGKKKLKASK
ncbi:geranylgeranylglyceryl/heptaprenylglyceryl phosphate synthase [Candidatus Mancarchaeum acidiphilum]|nr:geranylgeranylglyceryl/heptaprenylglyceryl phosphate synthase [Candidatus Mancarchaeum acidiphilum]